MTVSAVLIFSFERAISNSPVGILSALATRIVVGKLLDRYGISLKPRIALYGFVGSCGTIWDYASRWPAEYD